MIDQLENISSPTRGKLFVVSGSSGSGKGTILGHLLEKSDRFCYSVSATTRSPREGEKDGVNYHFITRSQFEELINAGKMLEYAEYCDNLYGTPAPFVKEKLDNGMNVLLEIEVQGAMQIKKLMPEAVLVFILPPSYESLKSRLSGRGTESKEIVEKRLELALREIRLVDEYDYIVVNYDGRPDLAAEDLMKIAKGTYQENPDAKRFLANFGA